MAESASGIVISSTLTVDLETFSRLSNLYLVTGEPALDEAREALARDIRRLLAKAEERAEDPEEVRLTAAATRRFETYRAVRSNLEAEAVEVQEVLRRIAPFLESALAGFADLQALDERRVEAARADVRGIVRAAFLAGGLAGALILALLAAVVVGVRIYALRPITSLHASIERLRQGIDHSVALELGTRETREVARAFNEMVDALRRQRERQLGFLAGVVHDLRNPLAAVKVGLQALERQHTPARRARSLELLDRQVDRMTRMAEDLLEATRIEAGKLELRLDEVDLRGPARDMVELYEPTTPGHQVVLTTPAAPVVVRADPLRIEQVVSNLVSNAIKFSPAGGKIEVAVGSDPAAGQALLTVTDQGIGIAPGDLKDIFLPFRRRAPDVAAGAGLGLSVVRRIVEAHGGTIEVESVPGAGSTFRVRIPVAGPEPEPEPEPRSDG